MLEYYIVLEERPLTELGAKEDCGHGRESRAITRGNGTEQRIRCVRALLCL